MRALARDFVSGSGSRVSRTKTVQTWQFEIVTYLFAYLYFFLHYYNFLTDLGVNAVDVERGKREKRRRRPVAAAEGDTAPADNLVQGRTGSARRELLMRASLVVDASGRGEDPLEASVRSVTGADRGVGVKRLHADVPTYFRIYEIVFRFNFV